MWHQHHSDKACERAQVRGEAANQKQQSNREYQPVCSSKMFTTIVDQPCEKEVRAEAQS